MTYSINLDDYTKWQDIYKDEFKPCLDSLVEKRDLLLASGNPNEAAVKELCDDYCVLFDKACLLLRWFLANKGLFQGKPVMIIKEAFSVELLDDGMSWINAYHLVKTYREKPETKGIASMIFLYIAPQNLKIYFDLGEKLLGYKENV